MPWPAATGSAVLGKELVHDDTPKVIKKLQFGVLTDQDVINQSQVELVDRRLFDLDKGHSIAEHGPLDKRMGISSKVDQCVTCKQNLKECNGHFGHVRLVLPVYHVGYFKKVIQILQSICKASFYNKSDTDRRKYLIAIRRAEDDSLKHAAVVRRVAEQCRKAKSCEHCGAINGLVRKAGPSFLKITHDKFKSFNSSSSIKKIPPPEKVAFDQSFESARRGNPELDKHVKKAMDDLNPLRALRLFGRMNSTDCELLGLRSARPESFLWQYVPAPPVCIRPSVGQESASTEDDITVKLGDIVYANTALRDALDKGAPVQSLIELWDFLSLQLAMYINSDVPGLVKGEFSKPMRSFVQRLKGKQGRFRGNLSGKRVDFSGRTVISPDPNLNIDEVAVPILVAKNMTYPEVTTRYNIEKLRTRIRNGHKVWPGATYVDKADGGFRLFTKFGNLNRMADELKEGDTVERHLEDGDIVLFNRQPSLHKLSILSHFVRVRPHRTFRLNECVCNPYNADFDGDEMNLHVPQTEEARTEAQQLMGVKHNIVTPKNGEPIISAIQDFITASFLLSGLDVFYDRKTFVNICVGMLEKDTKFELPAPSVIKPQALWTGKQVFNVLMSPNKASRITVNLDATCRDHKQYHEGLHRDLQDDSFLCIRNSEIMCGRMDKSTIGSGKKSSVFYILYRDFGADASARGMNRLSKLCARWLGNQGFSVGISDVTPPPALVTAKARMIKQVFDDCSQFVRDSRAGKLKKKAGLDDAGTLEQEQVRVLSTVRTNIAGVLTSQLSRRNTPMIMATSGSKGSNINVAQMAALLGQQDIEGKRVADGFQDRTLPHFIKHERSPPSKGFVSNSFFSGLLPYEFLFHAVGGRVGLVDTAVKTAETGYMSRRLMKSLEDLSTQYDRTVRNSSSNIVQFRFGDDELDPVDMEATARPVDFDRTFTHVEATTYKNDDLGLDESDIFSTTDQLLSGERSKLRRFDLDDQELPYDMDDDRFADQHESQREFLRSINNFIMAKAHSLAKARAEKKDPETLQHVSATAERYASSSVQSPPSKARNSTRKATTTASSRANKRQKVVPAEEKIATISKALTTRSRFDLTSKMSRITLETFIKLCIEKYERARVEPGHAVGAVGAQSIGEPGTQMTLKTFHFAGVAGMSLTAGVPRIKEIINASKDISTPVITCRLERRKDLSIPESLARIVKGRIESLRLEDITSYIEFSHSRDKASYLSIRLSLDTITELGLDITLEEILRMINKHRKFKGSGVEAKANGSTKIRVAINTALKVTKRGAVTKTDGGTDESLLRLQAIRRILPAIHILGYPLASRAVVMAEDDPMSEQIYAKRALLDHMRSAPDKKRAADQIDAKNQSTVIPDEDKYTPSRSAKKATKTRGQKDNTSDDTTIAVKKEEEVQATIVPTLPAEPHPQPQVTLQMHKVMVEGYGLRYCMNTPGVDPYRTTTNSVVETLQVLGIEAARSKIITEIQEVTKDLSIDPRHTALLADVMTYKGEVLGITRFGLAKMRDSVLQLASFEKTADHVFDAGAASKTDLIEGVSECVIVGKTMKVGTGSVQVVRTMGIQPSHRKKRPTLFNDAWN